jgi:hypothetical protein
LRPVNGRYLCFAKQKQNQLQLHASSPEEERNSQRRMIGTDNLGEPIYEDERGGNSGGGDTIDILGVKLPIDPISASLIVFALIAFQFFVLANL